MPIIAEDVKAFPKNRRCGTITPTMYPSDRQETTTDPVMKIERMVVIPGDFNLDGRVDLVDFNTFANNFTGSILS